MKRGKKRPVKSVDLFVRRPLAEKAAKYLKSYLATYQPKYWLFEGASAKQYSETSIQKVFTHVKENH